MKAVKWRHSQALRKAEANNNYVDRLKSTSESRLKNEQDAYLEAHKKRLGIAVSAKITQEQINKQNAAIGRMVYNQTSFDLHSTNPLVWDALNKITINEKQ